MKISHIFRTNNTSLGEILNNNNPSINNNTIISNNNSI